MMDEHVQRIEDCYDSIQAMLDSVEPMSYREMLLQDAMKALADILQTIHPAPEPFCYGRL